jgi:hypothetical protein
MTRTETFDSASRYTVTPGTCQVINGAASLLSPQTLGAVEAKEEYEASGMTVLTESVTKPGGTDIKYQVRIDGTLYYWNGAAWAASDGTNAQANTTVEINAHVGALPLVGTGSKLKIRAVLTGTALLSPSLSAFTITYTLNFVDPTAPTTCQVHVNLRDLLGAAFDNSVAGSFFCRSDAPLSQGGGLYIGDTQRVAFVADLATLTLVNTELSGKKVTFFVSYTYRDAPNVIKFYPVVIPDKASINLLDLTVPTTEVA